MSEDRADQAPPAVPVLAYAPAAQPGQSVPGWPLWLTALAASTPFVPFVRKTSPWSLLNESVPGALGGSVEWAGVGRALLAALFFAWPVLLVWRWTLRRHGGRAGPGSLAWRRILVAVAGVLAIATACMFSLLVQEAVSNRGPLRSVYAAPAVIGATAAGFATVALVAILYRRPSADVRVTAIFGAAILPHAGLSLGAAAGESASVGAALLAAAAVGLVVELSVYAVSSRYRGGGAVSVDEAA